MADVEYKFIDNTVLADEVIGHANISSISDGTLRGAVKKINTDLDGVKEHLGEVDKNIGNCTNILNLNKKSGTSKGITFTYNADDTYSVSGALLETAQYCVFTIASIKLDGTYKFVGCPSGGDNSNYYLSFSNTGFESKDIGQGSIFTFTGEASVHIVITTHDTLNLVFKPMISTNLNATYNDFVAYTGSTGKLTSDVAELQSTINSSLGTVTNMLKPIIQSQVLNGVTITNNDDGTITLSGTASANTYLYLGAIPIMDGTVKLIGCPYNGSMDSYYLRVQLASTESGGEKGNYYDTGNGVEFIPKNKSGALYIRIFIHIAIGTVCSNVVFKPMLTKNLNAQYSDFVAYTGSTGKLNSDVAELESKIICTTKIVTSNENGWFQFPTISGYTLYSATVPSGSYIYVGTLANAFLHSWNANGVGDIISNKSITLNCIFVKNN